MTRRDIVRSALDWNRPPYVPWNIGLTAEARQTLLRHYGEPATLDAALANHIRGFGDGVGYFTDVGNERVRDHFGVVWDRSYDKDIGTVEGLALPTPDMRHFVAPDPHAPVLFDRLEEARDCDRFCVYQIGFSLFERAWTLRGMENLLVDFIENPSFVHELFGAIADYNIDVAKHALDYGIDAVYFGDDWGQQAGLIMGPRIWKEFLYRPLRRMYAAVRGAGKYVFIHSCGDVQELFDDLVEIGVSCFNPFQPEVMDVHDVFRRYRRRLAFHGGLSTQRTLPFGSPNDVRSEIRSLLDMGRDGGYLFAPAHAVEGDVPIENLLAMIEAITEEAREAGVPAGDFQG